MNTKEYTEFHGSDAGYALGSLYITNGQWLEVFTRERITPENASLLLLLLSHLTASTPD